MSGTSDLIAIGFGSWSDVSKLPTLGASTVAVTPPAVGLSDLIAFGFGSWSAATKIPTHGFGSSEPPPVPSFVIVTGEAISHPNATFETISKPKQTSETILN